MSHHEYTEHDHIVGNSTNPVHVHVPASRLVYGYAVPSTDQTRGIQQDLYALPNGSHYVMVTQWSAWQNEPDRFYLVATQPQDAQPGGRFYELFYAAGLSRPLTLTEGIELSEPF